MRKSPFCARIHPQDPMPKGHGHDIAGLSRYLKLNEVPKLSGDNAFNKIQTLFKRANKVYLKGISIKGFVGEMDFTPIRKCRKSALSELETLLNVNID